MKIWRDSVWKVLISLVVIFLGGGLLAGFLTLVFTANPRTVSQIFCPPGSTAAVNPNYEEGSPNSSLILCHDSIGASVPPLTEDQSMAFQRKYLFFPSYLLMTILVIGWFLRPVFRRKKVLR